MNNAEDYLSSSLSDIPSSLPTDLQEYFLRLLSSSGDVLWACDRQGKLTFINPSGAKLVYGYEPSEMIGKSIADFHSMEYAGGYIGALKAMISGEKFYRYEAAHLRKDGSIIHLNINTYALQDQNENLIGAVGIASDVSERKQMEINLLSTNQKLTRMVQQLERRNLESALLNEMGDMLQSCLNRSEALNVAAEYFSKLFSEFSGAFYLIPSRHHTTELISRWGNPFSQVEFSPEQCWGVRRGRLHIESHTDSKITCHHLTHPPGKPILPYFCAPLIVQEEIQGLLFLQEDHPNPEMPLDNTAQTVVTALERLALSLTNINLSEILYLQSVRDPLTGLYNRRYLKEKIEKNLFGPNRAHPSLLVLVINIDNLKKINDAFGYEAGDLLFEKIGHFILSNVKNGEIAGRFGGEGISLLIPGMTIPEGMERAKLLQSAIHRMKHQFRGIVLDSITVSMGLATFPENGQNPEEVLRAASNALRAAREQGTGVIASTSG